jgi:trehalose/maltose hydrolase-like predicted phosphorylase
VAYPAVKAIASYWLGRAVITVSDSDGKRAAHLYDVMGPDEWHDHTNDSAYTNAAGECALLIE